VIIAAALTLLAVASGDDGEEMAASTSTTATSTTATGEQPPAPWRTATVPRSAVPSAYAEAWDRAGNKGTCALLFPLDGGPEMNGAEATADRTPNDDGWDIFLTSGAAGIEVLGLFEGAGRAQRTPGAGGFTRTWADGSVAKYGADVGGLPPGTFDPNTWPFEAVLTLPDQGCAYRIHDTLGKDHLEATFDRLRLMATP
jgi:hypothetical protein